MNGPGQVIGSTAADAVELGYFVDPATSRTLGPLRFHAKTSACLFGPARVGKGVGLIVPTLLRMRGRSLVVIDPKGELAAVTAQARAALGERVHVINPFGYVCDDFPAYGDLQSGGFNPLAFLDPASLSFATDAAVIGEALISDEGGAGRHWTDSARSLVEGVTMHATIEARAGGRAATMREVRALLSLPSAAGNPALGFEPSGLPALAAQIIETSECEALRNIMGQFVYWTKEKDGIQSTALRQTKNFEDEHIKRDTERGGFDFATLRRQATTVYVIVPPTMLHTQSKWLRLVISSAINTVMKPKKPGELDVLFLLEEAFSLGALPAVENNINMTSGYGVTFWLIYQSLAQLEKTYGDKGAALILSAMGVASFFRPNDVQTAALMSRMAGQRTVTVANQGTGQNINTHGGGQSVSLNYSQVQAPLMLEQEARDLPPDILVSFFAGASAPVKSKTAPYWTREDCRAARANPYHLKG